MARRYPLSRATKELVAVLGLLGMSQEEAADADADLCDALTGGKDRFFERLDRVGSVRGGRLVELYADTTWVSRWAACKHVYRIDPHVAAALATQPLEGRLPVDALSRLPYPIVYIDSPVETLINDRGVPVPWRAEGFLAYVDHDPRDMSLELNLVFIHDRPDQDGRTRNLVQLGLGCSTLDEMVGDVLSYDQGYRDAEAEREAAGAFSRYIAQALNLLLYVVSEEEDAEVVYAPPRDSAACGQRAGRRTNPETVSLLGARVGRAIGAARSAGGGSPASSPTGRSVSPHIRRGHWASFWAGPRKGRADGRRGDRLVIRWIPPIEVNGGGAAGAETVHLDEPGGGGR